ncbi:MAG: subfamily polymerase sigma factor, polymerase sigma-70 factor, subfamily [Candidatus Adlerbacteria bacterium]|nr:subfamily polymerase sigma factor, polymerase sigma-70 factor, subfamily [Candidatus Adlerbacteria bacterium]
MIYATGMGEYLDNSENLERSDEEILALSISNPSLFALLVRKYEAPFLRKARSIIREEEEAEDIVQEAFTKIYLNAKKFKVMEGAQFSSWAYRIVINTALSHYAKRKRRGMIVAPLDDEILQLIPDKTLDQFDQKELRDEVASVVSRMSPMFASVLTLFFIDGKSQEEIATQEGVTVGAIKTRVHRAKEEFRKLYKSVTELP